MLKQIKVPKNMLTLTNKLPAANYETPIERMFKNKSMASLKLPKLT